MNKLTYRMLGISLIGLAATSPAWAQGGPTPSGSDNAAKAGVGNQVTNPADGIPEARPGDDAGFGSDDSNKGGSDSDSSSDSMQQAYKDYSAKKFPVAATELRAIVKKSPNIVEAHQMLADIYVRQNQLPQAIPEMEAVVRLKPKDSVTRYNLGVAYLQVGQTDKAISLFQAAVLQNPRDATYGYRYGIALDKAGRHADAGVAFEKAAILDPKNSQAALDAGIAYHEAGNETKAVPYLKAALASGTLNTNDKFNAYTMLAEAASTAKDSDGVIQNYTLAAQAKPDDFGTQANLGVAEQNAGKKAEAEASYRQALTRKADDPKSYANIQSNLAMLLAGEGKFDEAVTLLTQAAQASPTDVSLQDNLGYVYEKQSRPALALAAYQQALTINPNNGIAKDGVARLGKK